MQYIAQQKVVIVTALIMGQSKGYFSLVYNELIYWRLKHKADGTTSYLHRRYFKWGCTYWYAVQIYTFLIALSLWPDKNE